MIKHLLIWLTASALLFGLRAAGQGTDSPYNRPTDTLRPHCGVTSPLFHKEAYFLFDDPTIPLGYPLGAIETCGKFKVYYDDVAYSSGGGFDGGAGSTRRSTLCSVLTYIQSVYDFSNIPSGEYIRLHVNTSYLPVPGSTSASGLVAYGAPFFHRPVAAGAILNGFVHDYIIDGADPAPNQFHGEIRINFDKTYIGNRIKAIGHPEPLLVGNIDFQSGLADPEPCQFDLFTVLLHSINHTMGHYSMADITHGGIWTLGTYTSLDTSVRRGPLPKFSSNAFTAPLTQSYLTGDFGFWLDNSPAPYRTMTDYNTHFNEYYEATRFSMGDFEQHVMEPYFTEGKMTRQFSKAELKVGHNILGYNFNPTSFAGSSATAQYYANKRPYCSKNFSWRYNNGILSEDFYQDTVTADFKIVNNIGTSLVINLAADTSLHDDDGDSIRVFPGSLVNLRGCGQGGNNHSLLKLSNGNKTITYTPRQNFYGRAQMGMNLTDGKEKGTWIIYTIDVEKGTNVIAPAFGGNLVLNGDFEEGSEVKLKDTAEMVNHTAFDDYDKSDFSRIMANPHYSDCHPYSQLTVIRDSYVECWEAWTAKHAFGTTITSFPWPWDTVGGGPRGAYRWPNAKSNQGNRYEHTSTGSMYNLADSLRKCHTYQLEMDLIKTYVRPGIAPFAFVGQPIDTFWIGFTDGSHIVKTAPIDAVMNQALPPYGTDKLNSSSWYRVSIPFSYCSDKPSTIMYVRMNNAQVATRGFGMELNTIGTMPLQMTDNVTLRETNMTVYIKDSAIGNCITRLKAMPSVINSCAGDFIYTWTNMAGKVIGTTAIIDVSPSVNSSYILTVSNGCQSAKDTVAVQSMTCPCGPRNNFGDTVGFYTLAGTIFTAPPPTGALYIPNDITIANTLTLSNASVLIRPGVTITVLDSVKLTIDSCHLFTCLDTNKLWKGIVLNSGPGLAGYSGKSARIEVRRNSMIEDAEVAITCRDAKPSSTPRDIIVSTNSVYNRNQVDIYIDNLTAYTAASTVYPFTITGNVFTARMFKGTTFPGYPRKWPTARQLKDSANDGTKPLYNLSRYYTKSLCKNGVFSNAGILLNKMGFYDAAFNRYYEVVIGGSVDGNRDFNLFDNHGYGINATLSNVSSYNNHFINIGETMEPSASIMAGVTRYATAAGIYTNNPIAFPAGYYRVNVTPLVGAQYLNANKFHDCIRAVSATGYADVNVASTSITSSHVIGAPAVGTTLISSTESGIGVLVTGGAFTSKVNISNNDISNMVTGVTLNLTTTASNINATVTNNRLYSANPSLSGGLTALHKMTEGIYAYANAMMFTTATTGSLQISNNSFNKVIDGIRVANISQLKPDASNNYITMWDRSPVTGVMQYGIYFTQTKAGNISGNTINEYTGYPASDPTRAVLATFNTSLKVCNNNENAIGRGFDFAQLTAQAGTVWVGNTMSLSSRGFVLGSDIGHQSISSSGPFSFVGTSQNKWTGSWSGKFQTYVDGPVTLLSNNSKLYVRNITSGSVELPSTNFGTIIGNAYRYTGSASGSLIVSQASPLNCTGNIFGKPFPLFFGDVVWSILADSLGSYRPNQWMAQYGLWQEGLGNDELAQTSPEFAQFMNAAGTTRFKWLTDIETALANQDVSTAQNLISSQQSAAGTLQVAPGVTVTDVNDADYVVNHYLDYYNLYVKYLLGTLNDNDQLALAALADLCPAVDGGAVYQARSLLQTVTGDFVAYDDDSCMYGNGMFRLTGLSAEAQQQAYTLSPNPNNGRLLLRQQLTDDQPVAMSIYDIQGRIVMRSVLNFGKTRQQTVTMSAVTPGMYLLHLQDQAGKNYTIKFNVQ
ncbi:T9SS type A sorting domain-containing protein [Pedobacter sp. MC2016-24]|uniref:T9SS type A sorting domain-containing protein n=1 Tax=Pedobacter sp. MC2016-24 TaxID=2780090 RepID=UPI001881210B|nr:T9SS type A sorting domain-containing protein [Pedobacter sp. MC2016-24]MBE9598703.1 T9SS type A sorting domain-containing protein [Pedobacter sp. MC2016-24]